MAPERKLSVNDLVRRGDARPIYLLEEILGEHGRLAGVTELVPLKELVYERGMTSGYSNPAPEGEPEE